MFIQKLFFLINLCKKTAYIFITDLQDQAGSIQTEHHSTIPLQDTANEPDGHGIWTQGTLKNLCFVSIYIFSGYLVID